MYFSFTTKPNTINGPEAMGVAQPGPRYVVVDQICPEMQVNELHALYDEHHEKSSFLKTH